MTTKKKQRLQLPPRAQLPLAIAVPIVVIVAGWFLLVAPQRSKSSDLAAQVTAKQSEIALARAATVHAPKPQPIRVADVFRLIKAMPDDEDMPGIILQLNAVAVDAGIEFKTITPLEVKAGSGYQIRRIQLSFSGNFYALSDFLYRLRNLVGVRGGELDATGRLFSVDQLQFAEAADGFPEIDATVSVDAYIYGAGAAAISPTGVPPTGTDGTTTSGTTTATTTTAETATTPATAAPAPTGGSD